MILGSMIYLFRGRYLIDNSIYPMNVTQVQGRTLNRSSVMNIIFEIQDNPKDMGSHLNELNVLGFIIEISIQGAAISKPGSY